MPAETAVLLGEPWDSGRVSPARAKPAPAGGPWTFRVPNYTPPLLNSYLGTGVGKRHRLKKECREFFSVYSAMAGVPRVQPGRYAPRREVSLTVYGWPHGRLPDEDAFLKATLDALKTCGLIVDDRGEWCDWKKPVIVRWKARITEITLRDVP